MAAKRRKPGRKLHAHLRRRMREQGLSGKAMCRVIQCCESTFSEKLNGRIPWMSWEMHAIMDKLGAQPEEMFELFPPKGEEIPPVQAQRVSDYLADRNETAVSTPVLEMMVDVVRRLVPHEAI